MDKQRINAVVDRQRKLSEVLGDDLLRRDATLAAVAHMHVYADRFDLQTCLIEMVKAQTAAKEDTIKIASEMITPAKIQILNPATLPKLQALRKSR